MWHSDNCKFTWPVIGFFLLSNVYCSNNDLSISPLSHRTCIRPFGCPSHPWLTSSLSSKSSTPFFVANSWSSFLVWLRYCWRETPAAARAWTSIFFDCSTSFLFPVARLCLCQSRSSGNKYDGPISSGLKIMDCVSPIRNRGECLPRNPMSERIVVFLITGCNPPKCIDMWSAFSAPFSFRACPWLWLKRKMKSNSGYNTNKQSTMSSNGRLMWKLFHKPSLFAPMYKRR